MSTVELVWQPDNRPGPQTVTVLHVTPKMEADIAAAVEAREGDNDLFLTLPHVVVEAGHAPEEFMFRAWRVLSYRVVDE